MPDNSPKSVGRLYEAKREDLLPSAEGLVSQNISDGVDRRTFLMRSTLIGATAVMTGRPVSNQERENKSAAANAASACGALCRPERREEGKRARH